MKIFSRIAILLVMAGVLLGISGQASAQATRTWVSGVGDDANPCSRTAPCKTFAGAISKTATNGEINCIDPGGFGAVTITKSIVIDCGGTLGGVLNAGSNGIVVNAGASDHVTLRNIQINGAGTGINGINVLSVAILHVENVSIRAQSGPGINFQPTVNSTLVVKNAAIRDNGTHGVYAKPGPGVGAKVYISKSSLNGNAAAGLRVDDGGVATLADSVTQGNGTNGVLAYASGVLPTEIMLERVVTSGNGNGILVNGANASVRMSDITVQANNVGQNAINGGVLLSFGNNHSAGNAAPSSPSSAVASF